jgi:hypothetical protein
VVTDDRKQEILARLKLLDHHQLLQTQIVSRRYAEARTKAPQPVTRAVSRYELDEAKAPADAELRAYFQAQGLSGDPLNAAVVGFSREALRPAQYALQNASALSRLGSAFPPHPPAIKYPLAASVSTEPAKEYSFSGGGIRVGILR